MTKFLAHLVHPPSPLVPPPFLVGGAAGSATGVAKTKALNLTRQNLCHFWMPSPQLLRQISVSSSVLAHRHWKKYQVLNGKMAKKKIEAIFYRLVGK